MTGIHIPFSTMAQRHLVFAYAAAWTLQFGYAAWVAVNWLRLRRAEAPRK